jgi:mRNA interferase MazF
MNRTIPPLTLSNEGGRHRPGAAAANGWTGQDRPAIVLRRMLGFGDLLVCGISTQLQQLVADFDEIIDPSHADFKMSGLKAPSLIRLGFLAVLPASHFLGTIGSTPGELNLTFVKSRVPS